MRTSGYNPSVAQKTLEYHVFFLGREIKWNRASDEISVAISPNITLYFLRVIRFEESYFKVASET